MFHDRLRPAWKAARQEHVQRKPQALGTETHLL
jgi:hypothetical protein